MPAATLLLPSTVLLPQSEPPSEPLPPAVEDTVATDRVGGREPVLPPDLLALPLPPTLPLKLGGRVATQHHHALPQHQGGPREALARGASALRAHVHIPAGQAVAAPPAHPHTTCDVFEPDIQPAHAA